jgi:hypothetical protein
MAAHPIIAAIARADKTVRGERVAGMFATPGLAEIEP